MVRINWVYPTTPEVTGGEAVIFELANAMAARGHEVRFFHGPATDHRVSDLAELPEMIRNPAIEHLIVDDVSDPSLPAGDIVLCREVPRRLGLPVTLIQGYRMLPAAMEELAFRAVGMKLCVATWLIDVGAAHGAARDQFVHLPPGLDHDLFALRQPIEQRSIDVAVLHHPHREKGWEVAERAITLLREKRPDTSIVVFGRRRPKSLPPGVSFEDSPDQARLAEEIYGRARVFVQASRNEGFGLTPLEAMACGAALVSTDCGGSRDYAFHDETAVVVPVEDPEALAREVGALLDDEPRRLRLARAGEVHSRTFRWDSAARLLEAEFARYLDDPAPFLALPAGRP
jgi:glycosyltransferase involved in cell wall biosynthesis